MLDEAALKAIEKLEKLAAEEIRKIPYEDQVAWNAEYARLTSVAGWVTEVKRNHANPYSASSVKSCLSMLRQVARDYKFNLKDDD